MKVGNPASNHASLSLTLLLQLLTSDGAFSIDLAIEMEVEGAMELAAVQDVAAEQGLDVLTQMRVAPESADEVRGAGSHHGGLHVGS